MADHDREPDMLTTLPPELITEIASYLDITALLYLQRTRKHLRAVLQTETPRLARLIQTHHRARVRAALGHQDYTGLPIAEALRRYLSILPTSRPFLTPASTSLLPFAQAYVRCNNQRITATTYPAVQLETFAALLCGLSQRLTGAQRSPLECYFRPERRAAIDQLVVYSRLTSSETAGTECYRGLLSHWRNRYVPAIPVVDVFQALRAIMVVWYEVW